MSRRNGGFIDLLTRLHFDGHHRIEFIVILLSICLSLYSNFSGRYICTRLGCYNIDRRNSLFSLLRQHFVSHFPVPSSVMLILDLHVYGSHLLHGDILLASELQLVHDHVSGPVIILLLVVQHCFPSGSHNIPFVLLECSIETIILSSQIVLVRRYLRVIVRAIRVMDASTFSLQGLSIVVFDVIFHHNWNSIHISMSWSELQHLGGVIVCIRVFLVDSRLRGGSIRRALGLKELQGLVSASLVVRVSVWDLVV